MKKQISLLITLLLTALVGISQIYSDSTRISNKQLLKAITLIEKGKVDIKQLELNNELINKMEITLQNKDSIITNQFKRIQTGDFLYNNLKKSYSNMETIATNNQMNYKAQIKITRRTKAKAYLLLVVGFFLSYVIYK
jgi:hypothetical protein